MLIFDGTASADPDGSITSFVWAFGDLTGAVAPVVPHAYRAKGTYTATLQVTDSGGLSAVDGTSAVVTPFGDGRFSAKQELLYDLNANAVRAIGSMVIFPSDSYNYRAYLQGEVVDPTGSKYTLAATEDSLDRPFSNPIGGEWTLTIGYFYVARNDPTLKVLLKSETTTRYVQIRPPPTLPL